MIGLLIDRKVLIKHRLKKLLDISDINTTTIHPTSSKTTKNDVGIIFLVPSKQYNNLVYGNEKLSYIKSKTFTDSVESSYVIIYNKKKKICEIRGHVDNAEHLNAILKSIIVYMPSDITIWAGVIPIENSETYIKEGFDDPHISDQSPLKYKFDMSGIAFSKQNSSKKVSETSVRNKLVHASTQTDLRRSLRKGSLCNIYACFTPNAIKHLKKINKQSAHKELAGSLIVSNVRKYGSLGNKFVFELSPDPNSEKTGDEEEVDAVWSRYNFHTHPKKAYENHGVTRGWPSSQDYVGFLQLNNHTIFHTVVTLEGIYVISLSPEWSGNVKNIDKKYILNHYDIDHKKKIKFGQYVDMINNKRYKGIQLFVVKFLSWNNSTDIFPVYYKKTGNKCLATENNFKLYV